jgi:hypothetical protein
MQNKHGRPAGKPAKGSSARIWPDSKRCYYVVARRVVARLARRDARRRRRLIARARPDRWPDSIYARRARTCSVHYLWTANFSAESRGSEAETDRPKVTLSGNRRAPPSSFVWCGGGARFSGRPKLFSPQRRRPPQPAPGRCYCQRPEFHPDAGRRQAVYVYGFNHYHLADSRRCRPQGANGRVRAQEGVGGDTGQGEGEVKWRRAPARGRHLENDRLITRTETDSTLEASSPHSSGRRRRSFLAGSRRLMKRSIRACWLAGWRMARLRLSRRPAAASAPTRHVYRPVWAGPAGGSTPSGRGQTSRRAQRP